MIIIVFIFFIKQKTAYERRMSDWSSDVCSSDLRAAYWAKAEERLIRAYTIERTLHTPVNFIVHSLHQVNDGLAHGRVFFVEVAKDGIALYEADDRELRTPKPKTPEQALAAATEYFEEWIDRKSTRLNSSH